MKPSTEIGKSTQECLFVKGNEVIWDCCGIFGHCPEAGQYGVQGWGTQPVVCVKYEGFEEAISMFLKLWIRWYCQENVNRGLRTDAVYLSYTVFNPLLGYSIFPFNVYLFPLQYFVPKDSMWSSVLRIGKRRYTVVCCWQSLYFSNIFIKEGMLDIFSIGESFQLVRF